MKTEKERAREMENERERHFIDTNPRYLKTEEGIDGT